MKFGSHHPNFDFGYTNGKTHFLSSDIRFLTLVTILKYVCIQEEFQFLFHRSYQLLKLRSMKNPFLQDLDLYMTICILGLDLAKCNIVSTTKLRRF